MLARDLPTAIPAPDFLQPVVAPAPETPAIPEEEEVAMQEPQVGIPVEVSAFSVPERPGRSAAQTVIRRLRQLDTLDVEALEVVEELERIGAVRDESWKKQEGVENVFPNLNGYSSRLTLSAKSSALWPLKLGWPARFGPTCFGTPGSPRCSTRGCRSRRPPGLLATPA